MNNVIYIINTVVATNVLQLETTISKHFVKDFIILFIGVQVSRDLMLVSHLQMATTHTPHACDDYCRLPQWALFCL